LFKPKPNPDFTPPIMFLSSPEYNCLEPSLSEPHRVTITDSMNNSKPLFGVSQFTTWHQTFEEDIPLYLELGVDAIEVCERKLSSDNTKAKEQLAYLKETKLPVCSIQPRVHALFPDSMSPDIKDPKERIENFMRSVDLFAEFFPDTPMVAISGNAPDYNFRYAHETARKLYPELAKYAVSKNMKIAFEPLSVVLMNNDSFISTLDEALTLIQDVNYSNFGLLLDVWHVWREPMITERLAKLGNIFAVHLCDWPKGEPRAIADRVIPGEGLIDLPSLFAAIEASGFIGAYALELFSADHFPDSLWQRNPKDVIEKSRNNFYKLWEAKRA
jgi:sugar phosphate isomerase/epimerase